MKLIESNKWEFEGLEIQPPKYYVRKITDCEYMLYRKIEEGEEFPLDKTERLYHDDDTYLLIGIFDSGEAVMKAVETYWNAIRQLNTMI
ncbi:hypothetical protein bcgnr5378_05640 [Bacillus cereus]|uniref:Uncharacterized protein n=1 Tax=Bacillus cereus TaxID=1396 RepID=A0A164LCA6_BACCE|nr:hypothetical protein [Bacillus cereus]KZD55659.1 hypothetical protein B4088_5404 [Bacillus cereus]